MMAISAFLVIGLLAGGFASLLVRTDRRGTFINLAVSLCGAMLGVVLDLMLGNDGPTAMPGCEFLAAGIGSLLLLLLFGLAQRLFLNSPQR